MEVNTFRNIKITTTNECILKLMGHPWDGVCSKADQIKYIGKC
jgi:hypothetical protein